MLHYLELYCVLEDMHTRFNGRLKMIIPTGVSILSNISLQQPVVYLLSGKMMRAKSKTKSTICGRQMISLHNTISLEIKHGSTLLSSGIKYSFTFLLFLLGKSRFNPVSQQIKRSQLSRY